MSWATRLVGRDAEIAELAREYRRAAAGEFGSVLLLADPGIGKTRLAREFLAQRRGRTIALSARAYALGDTAAFGLWSEALESHLRGLGSEDVAGLCDGFLDDLAPLVRSVAAARGSADGGEPPRSRLLAGLAALIANLAKRQPVVVFLDDAHLADASSWEGLGYLARALPDSRVLALVAARPAELSERGTATEVVLGLEQEGLLTRLELSPLNSEDLSKLVEAFIDKSPPRALVDWLHQRSRGNPLFALGLLQALVDEGANLASPELRSVPECWRRNFSITVWQHWSITARHVDDGWRGVGVSMSGCSARVILVVRPPSLADGREGRARGGTWVRVDDENDHAGHPRRRK